MRLRNRVIAEDALDHTALLPAELMHMMASFLSQQDVAAASMVCKNWSRVLRAGKWWCFWGLHAAGDAGCLRPM